MQIKRMVGAKARCVKRYDVPQFNVTPGEGAPRMRSRADIQDAVIGRAEQFAHQRNYTGPAKFETIDYKKALAELSPEERELERGFVPVGAGEGNQAAAASRHFAERIRHYEQRGHAKAIAVTLAEGEERASGLHKTRANLPTGSPWAAQGQQEQQDEIHRFSKLTGQRRGEIMVKTHAAGGGPDQTTAEAMRELSVDALVRRLAASVLHRGFARPDHAERAFADLWYAINFPPPLPTPGAGPATIPGSRPGSGDKLDDYNQRRQATVESVMDQTRRLLADPAQRHTLSPMPLGN